MVLYNPVVKVLSGDKTKQTFTNMYIDFTPSVKTLAKMKKIHKLREQKIIWTEVAKMIGHKPRYCRALLEYYRSVVLPTTEGKETK